MLGERPITVREFLEEMVSTLNFERLKDEDVLARRRREGYSRQRKLEFLPFPPFYLENTDLHRLHPHCHCVISGPQYFLLEDVNK